MGTREVHMAGSMQMGQRAGSLKMGQRAEPKIAQRASAGMAAQRIGTRMF